MKYAFLILFSLSLLFVKGQAVSQGNGEISGRVIDSATRQPVTYASIGLQVQETNTVVDGTITDDKGLFKISGVKEGNYKLLITFIDYKTLEKDNIAVSKTKLAINIGDVLLASSNKTLKEVTITSEKSLIENKIDKLVYNVDQDV